MKPLAAIVFFLFVSSSQAAERPNVLFILTEDQGAHLSFLETPGLQTPNIDSIAKSGVYFDNAFVAYPVCSASKAAFYTGLHSHVNGILNNTFNYHKPASEVTTAERNRVLWQTNRIHDQHQTLTEILARNGYYQGVTHKLHVLPNRKFPYDEFMSGKGEQVKGFIHRAKKSDKPWFLMVNIPNSHRPYPNSDKQKIRVSPGDVELPDYLPNTSEVRKDWAEYLASIEQVDKIVGETLHALNMSGEADNTLVILMSDHGPTFQHGKMTLYDLGLRVPLIFAGPGIKSGVRTTEIASEIDLLPTIVEWIEKQSRVPLKFSGTQGRGQANFLKGLHGESLIEIVEGIDGAKGREFAFAEISDRGPLPNNGIQERTVFDQRWKLIYRENVEVRWRQVNADSRMFKLWGNRTYAETIRVKNKFPEAFRVLQEMDPQNLDGEVPALELYDLKNDPHEMHNLSSEVKHAPQLKRLMQALRKWCIRTNDKSVTLSR